MLIDWFTVGAQALNFFILVWLMKRFLYKPILHAIDEREKRIATELANADKKKAEAQKESDEFKHKNEEFDQQRAALLSKATDEAKAERQRLLDEARQVADAWSAKRQETLRSDAHNLNQAISRRTQQEVFAIARKALTDLATTSLEERMGEVFTRRLRELNNGAKDGLAKALKTSSDPVLVRSAFELPAEQRAAIQKALNETFSAEIRVRFETAPDLISGIELTTNGQKVGWSIADYLASLEKGVEELLKEKDKAEAKAAPAPEAKAEPKHEAKTAPKPAAEATPIPEAKVEPKPEAQAEPKPEVKVESEPEAKAEPNPEAQAARKPEAETAPAPEAKAESQPVGKVSPEPEAKVEPKPEVQTNPKPESKVVPEPEAKAEPKPEAKTEPKTEEPKPETKS
jgi:F-type H+-transporting ATPase subunit b